MIDFACKQLDMNEVIKCSIGLTKSEYKVFELLREGKKHTTKSIAQELKLDLSTVQRAVKKLREKELVAVGQLNKKNGYEFTYEICSKKRVAEQISKIIDYWTEQVKLELRKY